MLFLKISNTNVLFSEGIFTWKSYTTNKILPTIQQVQHIHPKEFILAALNADNKTFGVYMTISKPKKMAMEPDKNTQIEAQNGSQKGAHAGALIFKKASTEILAKYSDYSKVFLVENAAKLSENTKMNEHTIELGQDKQPLYGSIYSLGSVKLETLKIYIKTSLANSFIRISKSPTGIPIFFDQKSDESPRLCVNYCGLNNITIKNRYLLSLIK